MLARRGAAVVVVVLGAAGCEAGVTTLRAGGDISGVGPSVTAPTTLDCAGVPAASPTEAPTSGAPSTTTTPAPSTTTATAPPPCTPTTPAPIATSTTAPPTTAAPTTAAPTTTSPTPTTVAPTTPPPCPTGPSLVLTPDGGPLGTVVTMVATCFPARVVVTFTVPSGGSLISDGGGGEGVQLATTDASGRATTRFTYHNRNGVVGSTTYPLAVSTDRNVLVDPCPPASCASATFHER